MPAASSTIIKGDVELIPDLWDLVRKGQLPAIADCADQQQDQSKLAAYHSYHNNHTFDIVNICQCDRCQDKQRDMRAMGRICTKEGICDTCLYIDVNECACGVGLCAKCRHVHS